jgi:hypothetical protein
MCVWRELLTWPGAFCSAYRFLIIYYCLLLHFLLSKKFRITRAVDYKDALSMVADGSDNQEYGLPYFAQQDKDTATGQKFKVLVMSFFPFSFSLKEEQNFPLFISFSSADSIVCCHDPWPFHLCL